MVAVLLAVTGMVVGSQVAASPAADAVTAGSYGSPVWFPLRGDHLIGCTFDSSGPICGGHYHPYWALDIKGGLGDPIYAAGAGQVVSTVTGQDGNCNPNVVKTPAACPNGSKGNSVVVKHGNSVYTFYEHMKTVLVHDRDWVDQNTELGTVGNSGWATPGFYHLHFERRATQAGSRVDPGPLKACVGTTLKTYPHDLTPSGAGTSWNGLPGHKYTAHSDGTSCTAPAGGGSGGGGKPKVDLVFAIDTTGSMGPYIGAVDVAAKAIAGALFSAADARVALVDYKDLYACPSDGYAARVDLPFSISATAFGSAVDGLSAAGGCDIPESVYSGIMAAIRLPWRSGVTKAVLVMGDAGPHDPEPTTGYTRATVAAAAKAVDPAAIYSVNIYGGGSPYFEQLAADSGGTSFPASDPSSAVDQILAAVTAITNSALVADAGGPYSGAVGDAITFDASGSGGGPDPIVSYGWDFNNDGTVDQVTTLPTVSHAYAAPYTGKVAVTVTTAAPASGGVTASATATADVSVLTQSVTRYAGQHAGLSGHSAVAMAFVSDVTGRVTAGVPVSFTLGAATCSATTDGNGEARCSFVVPSASELPTCPIVEAEVTGTDSYIRSSDTAPFTIAGAPGSCATRTSPE